MPEREKTRSGGNSKKSRQMAHNGLKYARYRNEHRREKNKRRRAKKLELKYARNRERRMKLIGGESGHPS